MSPAGELHVVGNERRPDGAAFHRTCMRTRLETTRTTITVEVHTQCVEVISVFNRGAENLLFILFLLLRRRFVRPVSQGSGRLMLMVLVLHGCEYAVEEDELFIDREAKGAPGNEFTAVGGHAEELELVATSYELQVGERNADADLLS